MSDIVKTKRVGRVLEIVFDRPVGSGHFVDVGGVVLGREQG